MSVAAGIWKHSLLRNGRAGVKTQGAAPVVVPADDRSEGPVASLVRQIFFSPHTAKRTRVLLVAAGRETDVAAIAENAAKVLSHIASATVAVVQNEAGTRVSSGKGPQADAASASWRTHSSQIAECVWRIPAGILPQPLGRGLVSAHTTSDALPFDYALFASLANDDLLPLLCSYCDGAVLVITANQTRRESALQAKRILQRCNVELLGTVLEGRQFPIPDSIYRRL
jgi:hypothetical protein